MRTGLEAGKGFWQLAKVSAILCHDHLFLLKDTKIESLSEFSRFLKESGPGLSADDLLTEAAVAEIKEQQGKTCKTRKMASKRALAQAGSWRYRRAYPSLSSRVIRNTGMVRLRHTGN
jgi:hypothetical protein